MANLVVAVHEFNVMKLVHDKIVLMVYDLR